LRSGAKKKDIALVRVPGRLRFRLRRARWPKRRKYDAVICIGCLLRGDTAHYDVIVNEVTRGIGQSAQETGRAACFGVLTCETLEQAIDRAGLKMGNKGFEAALAAVEMANLKKRSLGRCRRWSLAKAGTKAKAGQVRSVDLLTVFGSSCPTLYTKSESRTTDD
jgi:6,7-dimethyl-8-ribityllumazine synthase